MESREGIMNSGVTVIAAEAPSSYHVASRTDNSTALSNVPQAVPISVVVNNAGGGSAAGAGGGTSEKKKRGRPRKYGTDGGPSSSSRTLSPMPISSASPPVTGNYLADNSSGGRKAYSSEKKQKHPKVENLGEFVACSTGGSFLPHMITVNAGEDVSMKIISFCQQGPRAICIISAVGLISNVTLRQPNSSGGTLTYEGRFEILSLSGSFTPTELGGNQYGRTGGMSISLASPDGRVVGGTLAGLLIAASPVQVVVGSFLPSNLNELMKPKKHKYVQKAITGSAPTPLTSNMEHRNFNTQGLNNTLMSEGGQKSTIKPSSTLQTGNWPTMSTMEDSRKPNTDINIPLQGQ